MQSNRSESGDVLKTLQSLENHFVTTGNTTNYRDEYNDCIKRLGSELTGLVNYKMSQITKLDGGKNTQAFAEMGFTTHISNFIVNDILNHTQIESNQSNQSNTESDQEKANQKNIALQAMSIIRWMQVAKDCSNRNDYSSAAAILIALNNMQIDRLEVYKYLKENVTSFQEDYKKLNELYGPIAITDNHELAKTIKNDNVMVDSSSYTKMIDAMADETNRLSKVDEIRSYVIKSIQASKTFNETPLQNRLLVEIADNTQKSIEDNKRKNSPDEKVKNQRQEEEKTTYETTRQKGTNSNDIYKKSASQFNNLKTSCFEQLSKSIPLEKTQEANDYNEIKKEDKAINDAIGAARNAMNSYQANFRNQNYTHDGKNGPEFKNDDDKKKYDVIEKLKTEMQECSSKEEKANLLQKASRDESLAFLNNAEITIDWEMGKREIVKSITSVYEEQYRKAVEIDKRKEALVNSGNINKTIEILRESRETVNKLDRIHELITEKLIKSNASLDSISWDEFLKDNNATDLKNLINFDELKKVDNLTTFAASIKQFSQGLTDKINSTAPADDLKKYIEANKDSSIHNVLQTSDSKETWIIKSLEPLFDRLAQSEIQFQHSTSATRNVNPVNDPSEQINKYINSPSEGKNTTKRRDEVRKILDNYKNANGEEKIALLVDVLDKEKNKHLHIHDSRKMSSLSYKKPKDREAVLLLKELLRYELYVQNAGPLSEANRQEVKSTQENATSQSQQQRTGNTITGRKRSTSAPENLVDNEKNEEATKRKSRRLSFLKKPSPKEDSKESQPNSNPLTTSSQINTNSPTGDNKSFSRRFRESINFTTQSTREQKPESIPEQTKPERVSEPSQKGGVTDTQVKSIRIDTPTPDASQQEKERLRADLDKVGREEFVKNMVEKYKGKQNEFADMLFKLKLNISDQKQGELKSILENEVMKVIALPQLNAPSQGAELATILVGLSKDMANLSGRLESAKKTLDDKDYLRLKTLLLPYMQMGEVISKLSISRFTLEEAEKNGLKICRSASNMPYLAYEDINNSEKKKMADEYISQLRNEVLNLANNEDYKRLTMGLQACNSVNAELSRFTEEIRDKYKVGTDTLTNHPLSELFYGKNRQTDGIKQLNGELIKPIQVGPRIGLTADEILKIKPAEFSTQEQDTPAEIARKTDIKNMHNKLEENEGIFKKELLEGIKSLHIVNNPLKISEYLNSSIVTEAENNDANLKKETTRMRDKAVEKEKTQLQDEIKKITSSDSITTLITSMKGQETKSDLLKERIVKALDLCQQYCKYDEANSKSAQKHIQDLAAAIKSINEYKHNLFDPAGQEFLTNALRSIEKSEGIENDKVFTATLKTTIDIANKIGTELKAEHEFDNMKKPILNQLNNLINITNNDEHNKIINAAISEIKKIEFSEGKFNGIDKIELEINKIRVANEASPDDKITRTLSNLDKIIKNDPLYTSISTRKRDKLTKQMEKDISERRKSVREIEASPTVNETLKTNENVEILEKPKQQMTTDTVHTDKPIPDEPKTNQQPETTSIQENAALENTDIPLINTNKQDSIIDDSKQLLTSGIEINADRIRKLGAIDTNDAVKKQINVLLSDININELKATLTTESGKANAKPTVFQTNLFSDSSEKKNVVSVFENVNNTPTLHIYYDNKKSYSDEEYKAWAKEEVERFIELSGSKTISITGKIPDELPQKFAEEVLKYCNEKGIACNKENLVGYVEPVISASQTTTQPEAKPPTEQVSVTPTTVQNVNVTPDATTTKPNPIATKTKTDPLPNQKNQSSPQTNTYQRRVLRRQPIDDLYKRPTTIAPTSTKPKMKSSTQVDKSVSNQLPNLTSDEIETLKSGKLDDAGKMKEVLNKIKDNIPEGLTIKNPSGPTTITITQEDINNILNPKIASSPIEKEKNQHKNQDVLRALAVHVITNPNPTPPQTSPQTPSPTTPVISQPTPINTPPPQQQESKLNDFKKMIDLVTNDCLDLIVATKNNNHFQDITTAMSKLNEAKNWAIDNPKASNAQIEEKFLLIKPLCEHLHKEKKHMSTLPQEPQPQSSPISNHRSQVPKTHLTGFDGLNRLIDQAIIECHTLQLSALINKDTKMYDAAVQKENALVEIRSKKDEEFPNKMEVGKKRVQDVIDLKREAEALAKQNSMLSNKTENTKPDEISITNAHK